MHPLRSGRYAALILSLLLVGSLALSASAFTVTNASDSGAGSLRQAIADANAAAGVDTIDFAIPGGAAGWVDGTCTITLTSGVLAINSDILITGPGAALLTVARSNAAGTPTFSVFSISLGRTVEFSGLTIRNGHAGTSGSGGGISSDRSTVTVRNCVIRDNTALNGGAIANQGVWSGSNSILTVIDSTLSGNIATSTGGGIANLAVNNATGTVRTTVLGSTLSGNSAAYGGAIRNDQGAATLIVSNSTLSGNSQSGTNGTGGGAIFSYFAGQVTVANTTFANNVGRSAGAAIYSQGNPVPRVGNCIVKKMQGTTLANFGGWGVTSDGYNIGDDSSGPNNLTTDRINTDSKLQPLQDNGGPTLTHAPAPDSPAIDKGKNLATDSSTNDQRGRSRAFVWDSAIADVAGGDESDIGAVEVRLPGTLALTASTNTVSEGVGNAPITVSRSGGSEGPVTAKLVIANGTTNSSDFMGPGALDTGFNPGTGIGNQVVYALAEQADGKVIIGGTFTTYNGVARARVARVNSDGSLDTSFDPGTGVTGSVSTVYAVAIQPDGKILIAGEFTAYRGVSRSRLARLNADGTLDTTFDPGTGANSYVTKMVLQPDGKIIIAHTFSAYNGTARGRIARVNADGSLDTTFATGTGADGNIRSLALQPDGKVLIGGEFSNYDGTPKVRCARLTTIGSLDTTFTPPALNSFVEAFAVQPDGKIIIGGSFTNPSAFVARLNVDGSLDATFTGAANNAVSAITVQPDGQILIGGAFTAYNSASAIRLARLNTNGTRDTTFASSPGANSTVFSMALRSDGKVMIGGNFTTYNGTARSGLARVSGDLLVSWAADDSLDKTVHLPIVDDAVFEGDQTLTFTLVPISGFASLGTPSTQTLTILDNDSAPVVQLGAAIYSISESSFNTVNLVLTITGATEVPVSSVNYATSNGTAIAGSDYATSSGTLNISPGQTTGVINVSITRELIYERDETFNVTLSSPSNVTLGAQSNSVVTITNDDPAPVLKLSADNYTFDENTGVATLTVTKTGLTALDATVHYSTTNGSAIAGADFTNPAADLVVGSSETSKTFQITLNNENIYELTESFTALLSTPVDATLGTPSAATVAITNDDPPPVVQFSAGPFTINEGGTATVTITKIGATEVDASVHYATSDGTATAGTDYTAVSGDVTFGPAETSKEVTIPIAEDTLFEGNEDFNLLLTAPVHATLQPAASTTTVTIIENDLPPVIEFSSPTYEISEAGPTVTITVVKSGETSVSASVGYATADNSAMAASDYTAASGTLTFGALEESKTFSVAISDEAFYEHSEIFALVLSAPVNATLGTNATASTTITNNDPAPVVAFSATGYSANENGISVTLRLMKTGLTEVAATVSCIAADGSATAPDDYPSTNGTVTIGASEIFKDVTIAITDDSIFEMDESFTVTLLDPLDAQIGEQASALVTIIENDAPPTIQFSSTTFSASEGGSVVTVTVTKTGSTALGAGIHYATSDGSAGGSDYTATSGDLEFAPGETTKTFEVPLSDDARYEGNESFAVTLTAPVNATIGSPATATATITENDAPPTLQFSATSYTIGEAGPVATITVTKVGATDVPASVNYTTADGGTAAQPGDYTLTSGTLTLLPGENSKTIEIPIIDDSVYEGSESFGISLTAPVAATRGTARNALITITDNDPAPVVQFDPASVSVEEEAGSVTLTLTKSGTTEVPATVQFQTSNGSAIAGTDYGVTSGYVNFAAGETSKQVSIVILNDGGYEPDETFFVSLTAVSDVTIGSASTATVTILVNDTSPEITVQQPSGNDLTDGQSIVTFGPVVPHDEFSRTFTIRNYGTGNLTGLSVTLDGTGAIDFSVTAQPAGTVVPGGSTVFTIKFAPSAAGTREAALHIASNYANGSSFDISLSGSSYTHLEAFRLQHFGSVTNSGAGADINDFDLDGLSNLLEFATGTNPKLGNGAPGALILNGSAMEFTYLRTRAAVEDGLSFAVEWNNELTQVNWVSTGVTQQKMSETGTTELWKAVVPKGTDLRRFLRLKILMQP